MKALQEEVELLKKSDETLRDELKNKDDEIQTLKTSLSEVEAKLEAKEDEIKSFLSVGVQEGGIEKKSSPRNF
jgi:predicted  nucleic acid-binding Zn-ribbon protein